MIKDPFFIPLSQVNVKTTFKLNGDLLFQAFYDDEEIGSTDLRRIDSTAHPEEMARFTTLIVKKLAGLSATVLLRTRCNCTRRHTLRDKDEERRPFIVALLAEPNASMLFTPGTFNAIADRRDYERTFRWRRRYDEETGLKLFEELA